MTDSKRRWHPRVRFPWRSGNQAELLIDGNVFFPEMTRAIDNASDSLDLEMYLFESGVVAGQFIHHLCEAAGRGVVVRVLLDGFGSLKLLEPDRRKMIDGGVELRFYNPLHLGKFMGNIVRDHRKLMIVDGHRAFIGGAGITDEFDPPLAPEKRWRETIIGVNGPVVADWKMLFDQVWRDHSVHRILVPEVDEPAGQPMRGRVSVGSGRLFRGIYRELVRRIRRARQRVWISTAYFVPSRQLRQVLRNAARQGLDVRLLLPGPETDHPRVRTAGRGFYSSLLKAGVRIFEFQQRVLHSKAVLCDEWLSVGSSNYDRWNLRWNLEANQEFEDPDFAVTAQAMFEQDFADSVEITFDAWRQRPWRQRLAERYWGWVEWWITWIGGRRWRD